MKLNILRDPSVFTLLLANVITLVLAVVEGWPIFFLMFIYWFQSVIIGFFTLIKILTLKGSASTDAGGGFFNLGNVPVGLFFLFHYGLFHFIYAVFIPLVASLASVGSLIPSFVPPLSGGVLIAIAVFYANHAYSFTIHWRKERGLSGVDELMWVAYMRIIPMHLTITLGSLAIVAGGSEIVMLVIFIGLKSLVDIGAHAYEHGRKEKAAKKREAEQSIRGRLWSELQTKTILGIIFVGIIVVLVGLAFVSMLIAISNSNALRIAAMDAQNETKAPSYVADAQKTSVPGDATQVIWGTWGYYKMRPTEWGCSGGNLTVTYTNEHTGELYDIEVRGGSCNVSAVGTGKAVVCVVPKAEGCLGKKDHEKFKLYARILYKSLDRMPNSEGSDVWGIVGEKMPPCSDPEVDCWVRPEWMK